MGATSSKAAGGIIVTLDALGTLYRFREPVARQYINVAKKCGLKADLDEHALHQQFRQAFKSLNTKYPNYGKGQLDNPEIWWERLVNKTFEPLVGQEEIPSRLGSILYTHFSSGSAYELYPDVKPFLESMKKLRSQFSNAKGSVIILGVITNSDPRVKSLLQSLGIHVGPSKGPIDDTGMAGITEQTNKMAAEMAQSGRKALRSPYYDFYDGANDFDFISNSYEADSEKPDGGIFARAKWLANMTLMSKYEQSIDEQSNLTSSAIQVIGASFKAKNHVQSMTWIHIGDDYEKDYMGAKSAGLQALSLAREGEDEGIMATKKTQGERVTSLEEAAAVIGVMAQQNFQP